MNQYVPSDEAARILGVSRKTLYTYASRGWVQTRAGRDRRSRTYCLSDLNALRQRAAAHQGAAPAAWEAMSWGPAILETAISYIDRDGPYYRGVSSMELAERGAAFEEAFQILVGRELHSAPLDFLPRATTPLEAMEEALLRFPEAPPFSAMLAGVEGCAGIPPVAGPAHERFARASNSHQEGVRLAMVMLADHELNASTFAARVAASTGASTHACLRAALATLSGPRHGTQSVAVLRSTDVISAQAPGMGHPLYPDGDPRFEVLAEWSTGHSPKQALAIENWLRACQDCGAGKPNVDVGLAMLAQTTGMRPGFTPALFALARSAGWIAHIEEQRRTQTLLRPRARYIGP